MRVAGRLAADVLDMIGPKIVPGVTTDELNQICHDYIVGQQQAIPARLTTVASEVDLHLGKPRRLSRHSGRQEAEARRHRQRGHHGDQGRLPRRHQPHVPRRQAAAARVRLCDVTYRAMCSASAPCGRERASATSARRSEVRRANHCSVVREYCGHGIGRGFHEDPQVLHYGTAGTGSNSRPA